VIERSEELGRHDTVIVRPAAHPPTRAGLALTVVMAGVLMTAIDTTIVVLALPEVERTLHVALASVVWVVVSYLLVTTLLATQAGRLGDMYGRVRMYEIGFLVFVAGSALCGLAWNGPALMGFRILQGVGAACVTANSGAIISDVFPREKRGKAYGYIGVGWSLGAVLGIVVGGLIVTSLSWRWIFWINVPIGVVVTALATRVLHERSERRRRRLDVAGMLTLGLGLLGVLLAATRLATSRVDPPIVGCGAVGLGLIVVFVLVERAQADPMLHMSIFRIPTMSGSLLAALFQGLANYAVLFLVIMYLQGPRGMTPIHASLVMAPGYLVGGILCPAGGWLADRYGPVLPATAGLAAEIAALLTYAQLSATDGLWLIVVASVVNGIGTGFFIPANNSAVMKASPPEVFGISSGMLRTFASIGWVLSFSTAILIASLSIPRSRAFAIFVGSQSLRGRTATAFTTGLHSAFYALTVIMIVAAALSATRSLHGRRG
jgi:EmrB/QacA subfamily drug resistance transporter